jgi:hypothetical protein
MEINFSLIFNIFIALVCMPMGWFLRSLAGELKDVTRLVYETREKYVSKDDLKHDMDRLIEMMIRLEDKIDKIDRISK